MGDQHHNHHFHKLSAAGLLITVGIIFGDIGTSPLYVLKAIVGDKPISPQLILGGLSCIFWTLTLQTTVKYVIITLRADNKGEGGIFSLFTLVRRNRKWLIGPAMIGGAALLADGIITPPISVASSIEGLRYFNENLNTIPIILGIIFFLFMIQQFGTKFVGKAFGPIMMIWFLMIGSLGIYSLFGNFSILKAINPYYAFDLLKNYPHGFWLLSAVFLCTTGAEALYSDLGHCGRPNIRISWIFVKSMLLLNYFGQGAMLLSKDGQFLNGENPFFMIVPNDTLRVIAVIVATLAAIVASQALISGSFTLINEAIRLNLWPKVKISYPSDIKGQLYIPSVNWLLFAGCVGVVLLFRESSAMEGAYGLSIVLCMLSTTILLSYYMLRKKWNPILIVVLTTVFLIIETGFFIANLEKFPEGGWLTIMIGTLLVGIMYVIIKARVYKNQYIEFVKIKSHGELIKQLSIDDSIPKYATHLVYMTSASRADEVEEKVIYSILQKQPKRADIYWFVHVNVVDEPYKAEYKVTHFYKEDVIRIDFILGFRVEPRINVMFRQVVEDMVRNKEIDITSRYQSLSKNNMVGDFKFIVIQKFLSNDNELPWFQKVILNLNFILKNIGLSEEKAFGLDTSNVLVEKFPLVLSKVKPIKLRRILPEECEEKKENMKEEK